MPDRRPLTGRAIRDGIARREYSATEVCRSCLDRIEHHDGSLRAFVTIDAERALARAAAIDSRPAGDAPPPLAGVPVAIKDNLCTSGLRTTAGSRMLDQFVPPYDATAVARLEAAGAIVIGKTNCDEFGMGSSTEHSAFGPSRNPWATDRTPGGSSGGSAVAVSAGFAPIALGSDTGGSIRQPAAFCSVLGLKPTYGRVSRYGLVAFASSLDQIGPIARTAFDAALVLDAIAGADPADQTSAVRPVPAYEAALRGHVRGLRVGVPWPVFDRGIDAEVLSAFDRSLEALRCRGASLVDVDLPHAKYGIPVYYLVATAEASANLARYDGVRYGSRAPATTLAGMYENTRAAGFGAEVKRRIMLGTYALSAGYYDAYYGKALKVRRLIHDEFERAYQHADVLLTPTSPSVAFPFGAKGDNPLAMYLCDVYTIPANLTGHPGMSVPFGTGAAGLPVGVQVLAGTLREPQMFRAAAALERAVS